MGLMQDIPHGKAPSHGLYLNQAHVCIHLTRAFVHVKSMAKRLYISPIYLIFGKLCALMKLSTLPEVASLESAIVGDE